MRKEQLKTIGFSALGVVGAYVIYALLIHQVVVKTAPPPVNKARIEERKKALAEVQATASLDLHSYGKIDATKGLYRLKIDQAMALTLERYKDPAAAHSNLVARAEKASFVPPPPTFE